MDNREIHNNPFSSKICCHQIDIRLKYGEILKLEPLISELVNNSGISYYRLDETDEVEIDEQENWLLSIYLDAGDNAEEVASYIRKLAASNNIDIYSISNSEILDQDWAAENQKSFTPIETGKFLIYSSYNPPENIQHQYSIEINASRAFGTGEHQTTKGIMNLLCETHDKLEKAETHYNLDILDLGTGTGILAIAAAKLFPGANIYATDIDEEATQIARENFVHNTSYDLISGAYFYTGDGPYIEPVRDKKFDIILANILAPPLERFASRLSEILKPGGKIFLSGFTYRQYKHLIKCYQSYGLKIWAEENINNWCGVCLEAQ
jgi:ribosomal protein L11 methyltransferase